MLAAFSAVPAVNASGQASQVLTTTSNQLDKMDWGLFAIFLGLLLAMLITSWLVPTHPIFIVGYILIAIVGVILSSILSNVWEMIADTLTLGGSVVAHFPIMNFLMLRYPIFVTVTAFIGLVVMFAKPQVQEGGE